MPPISARDLAIEIIDDCLDYGRWPTRTLDALIERALDESDEPAAAAASRALFGIVIERLADLFDPQLCDLYAQLFSRVIARALPECNVDDLFSRHRRVRQVRPFLGGEIQRVFVLSRITLGADVAVTSVMLNAMKTRFPDAEICLVGPAKNAELFAADERIVSIPVEYQRTSSLRERLLAAMELKSVVDEAGSLVVDPDSRMTQLGLIPVCDDSRYYFFESRAFGGSSTLGLPELSSLWLQETFGVEPHKPYVAPVPQEPLADCTVSWGVGENETKRIDDSFELELVAALTRKMGTVLVDRGAGGQEGARIDQLRNQVNSERLLVHTGTYASFASHIAGSKLYVGYDSAGQHVASAAGVPEVIVFAGYPSERMLTRWRPSGPNANVIAAVGRSRDEVLAETLAAIAEIR